MDGLDERVMTTIAESVTDPAFLYQRGLAQETATTAEVSQPDSKAVKAQAKVLLNQGKNLLTALRNAPSAADAITAELEKIARNAKT